MKPLAILMALAVAGPPRSEAAKRAEAAFDAGDFETAAEAAAQAYAEDGDPVFLYVRAQAERFGGDCDQALVHYREFIAAVPPGPATKAAEANIDECEQVRAQAPEPEPPPEDEPAEAQDPTTAPVDDVPPKAEGHRWYRDPWGGAMVGVGAVALGVGGGLYGRAQQDARAAREANDVVTYGERIDRAYVLSRAAVPVLAVGGALVVAGVVRWAVLASRERSARSERASLGPGGLVLRW